MAALRLTTVLEHDRDAHGNSMRRELFKRMTGRGGERRTFIRFRSIRRVVMR
jgi:hypothetical protein